MEQPKELLKLSLSSASGIFDNPLFTFLPLFGFAKNIPHALKLMRQGDVKVNGEVVNNSYILRSGDCIQVGQNAIVVLDSPL